METEIERRFDFVKFTLNRNDEAIRFSDTKAVIMLTASSLVLTSILEKSLEISHVFYSYNFSQKSLLMTSLFLLLFGFVIATTCALVGIFPRLTKSKMPGLIYFGDCLNQNQEETARKLWSMSSSDLIEQILQEIQTTSRIAYKKFICIRVGIVGIILMILGFLFGYCTLIIY